MTELLPNAAENLIKLREICDASAKKIVQLAQVWPHIHEETCIEVGPAM